MPTALKVIVEAHYREHISRLTVETVFSILVKAALRPDFRTKVLISSCCGTVILGPYLKSVISGPAYVSIYY